MVDGHARRATRPANFLQRRVGSAQRVARSNVQWLARRRRQRSVDTLRNTLTVSASVLAPFLAACAGAAQSIPPRLTNRGNPATGPTEPQLEHALFEGMVTHG